MPFIKYTEHLKLRIQLRSIPEEYPRMIFSQPDQKYIDISEGRMIAVKKLFYNGKERNMMIAYEESLGIAEIITIHPVSDEQVVNRVLNGRWSNL